MKRSVVAVALLFVAGCHEIPGDGRLVAFDVDSSFSVHEAIDSSGTVRPEIDAVREGIHAWDGLGVNFWMTDETPKQGVVAIGFGIHRSDGLSEAGVCWPGLGFASIYADSIESSRFPSYEAIASTVAHEIGHAMGLSHINEDGIMNPAADSVAPTPADVREFRSHWN